jgi:hypothetical protein
VTKEDDSFMWKAGDMTLQLVGLFRQAVRQIDGHFGRLILIQQAPADHFRQIGAVDSPRHIMSGRNGEKGPRIVIETDRIGESGRFHDEAFVAHHPLGTVEEPPGRPELKERVMAGQGGQFAAVGALIEGKEDHRQTGLVSETVQEGFECSDVIGPRGDVGPLVAAEVVEQRFIMVAPGTGVDLDNHAVFEAHPHHLGEDLPSEELRLLCVE